MNKCLTIGSGCFLVFPFCFLSKKAPESRISNLLPRKCKTQTSHPLEKYRSDWLAPQVTSHHADSRQCGGWKTAWQKKNQNNKLKCHPPKKKKKGGKFSSQTGSSECVAHERSACLKQLCFYLRFQWDVGPPLPPLFISISN